MPRPIFIAATLAVICSANGSATDACTMKRLAAVHAWPMLRNLASIAPATAASRSASSKIRNGALPPSSIDVRNTSAADCWINVRPTSVDPVKLSFRSRGSAMIGSDTSPDDVVVTTLTTPSGRPASASSCTT